MIGTRKENYKKIIENLNKNNDVISIISCNTCVRLADTGGEKVMRELATKLMEDSYNVVNGHLITLPCEDHYFENVKLYNHINTIIMLSCASGRANALYHFPNCKIVSAIIDRGVIITEIQTQEDGTVKKQKKIRGVKS